MLALWVGVGLFTGAGGTVAPPPPLVVIGGGSYNFLNPRKRKREDDELEQDVSREALEIVKIGKAPNEVITGIVIPRPAQLISRPAQLDALSKASFDAAKAKSDRLRQIQLADDEWLLLN